MLFSVEQAFVGRDEKRAPPKNACVGGYYKGHLWGDWYLSNDDGDGNENGKKALHVQRAFWYTSLPSLHDYNVKLPKFTFIAPYSICIILHIIRKTNSIIVLLFIQNVSNFMFASIGRLCNVSSS